MFECQLKLFAGWWRKWSTEERNHLLSSLSWRLFKCKCPHWINDLTAAIKDVKLSIVPNINVQCHPFLQGRFLSSKCAPRSCGGWAGYFHLARLVNFPNNDSKGDKQLKYKLLSPVRVWNEKELKAYSCFCITSSSYLVNVMAVFHLSCFSSETFIFLLISSTLLLRASFSCSPLLCLKLSSDILTSGLTRHENVSWKVSVLFIKYFCPVGLVWSLWLRYCTTYCMQC